MRARKSSKKVSEHDPVGDINKQPRNIFRRANRDNGMLKDLKRRRVNNLYWDTIPNEKTNTAIPSFLRRFMMELETCWCYRFEKSICIVRAFMCFGNCENEQKSCC